MRQTINGFIFSRFAIKHAKLGLSRTMVLTVDEPTQAKSIAAYYTLTASTIYRKDIPNKPSLPAYPVPVALLARLAIDIKYQGRYLGEKTLIYALHHTVRLCDKGLPAYGVILEVLDQDALKFYQKFNFFQTFSNDPMRLFVSMKTLKEL